MNKVGLISMGSRRNRPFWEDLISLLEPECAVEMRGVLDDLTRDEIEDRFAFSEGENYIVTEMYWGGTVHISEAKARIRVAQIAEDFFREGASAVLVLCTGDFDRPGSEAWKAAVRSADEDWLRSEAGNTSGCSADENWQGAEAGNTSCCSNHEDQPGSEVQAAKVAGTVTEKGCPIGLFLLPEDLMYGLISGLRQDQIGFIVPEQGQIAESEAVYASLHPVVKAASPYGTMEKLRETAASFRTEPVNVVVTDCMGFTAAMGRIVAEESGKQVLVPRLILPKIVKALVSQI